LKTHLSTHFINITIYHCCHLGSASTFNSAVIANNKDNDDNKNDNIHKHDTTILANINIIIISAKECLHDKFSSDFHEIQ